MKLSLLAFLALPAVAAAEFKMPNFRGSGPAVLADIEVEGDGIQPEYCDGAPNNPETTDDNNHNRLTPDEDCWPSNDGYPKCCSKNKGTCPYGTPPLCEDGSEPDGGNNNDDGDRDGDRCNRNSDCRSDEYCQKRDGYCNSGDQGLCEEMPRNCPKNIDRVCGCNRVTYDNDCEANAAGQNVKYWGRCD